MGGIPFPINQYTQQGQNCKKQYILRLREYCFTTNFSVTKSSGQNLFLLWNKGTGVKYVHAKLTLKLHSNI